MSRVTILRYGNRFVICRAVHVPFLGLSVVPSEPSSSHYWQEPSMVATYVLLLSSNDAVEECLGCFTAYTPPCHDRRLKLDQVAWGSPV